MKLIYGIGFDTVGLGFSSDEGPTLKHQIVSTIVSDTWWFGMLGLGSNPRISPHMETHRPASRTRCIQTTQYRA
jgi:hypothetical protein